MIGIQLKTINLHKNIYQIIVKSPSEKQNHSRNKSAYNYFSEKCRVLKFYERELCNYIHNNCNFMNKYSKNFTKTIFTDIL